MSEQIRTSFTDWDSGFRHHGIKGQKWGVRRYQNPDGTLTAAGKKHEAKSLERDYKRESKKLSRLEKGADREYQRKIADRYKAKAAAAGGLAAVLGYKTLMNPNNRAQYEYQPLGAGTATRSNLPSSSGQGPSLRRREKYVVSEGKGVHIHGEGLVSQMLGGPTNAPSVYYKNPAIVAMNSGGGAAKIVKPFSISNSTKVLAGATAVTAGYAIYSGIRSHMANKRTTDAGHKQAVEKYKQQYSKMVKSFANTPYSNLVQKQNQSFNKTQAREKSAIKKANSTYKAYMNAVNSARQMRSSGKSISGKDYERLSKLREEAIDAANVRDRVTGKRIQR